MRTVGATPQDRPRFGLGPIQLPRRTILIVAFALLLATAGAIAIGSRLLLPDPVPVEPLTVAGQIIEAVNTRDLASLRSLMAEDGVLAFPSVDARAGREGEVDMSDWEMTIENFPEAWMGGLDRWGMEAQVGSCQRLAESTITCAVATRWHTLQIEIGEAWTFEFDGRRVARLEMLRVDPDPPDRLLPLGLTDLSSWEAWLQETHPAQAARLLPSGPDLLGHMYFRFGLDASPEEIGDSIREYLESRQTPTPSASQRGEWFGPVRTDLGQAVIAQADEDLEDEARTWYWPDPVDAAMGWVDITRVVFTDTNDGHWYIELASRPPPATGQDGADLIVAHGLVLDTTGDGVADYVVGLDDDGPRPGDFRAWVTNLATGVTEEQSGPPYGYPVEFAHYAEGGQLGEPPAVGLTFLGASAPAGFEIGSVRYYVWTSVTEAGRVVAWDYAPDAAWLDPSDP